MVYDEKWFENNMCAVPTHCALGKCSFCCFRNLDKEKFCYKLRCVDPEFAKSVYWQPQNDGLACSYLMGLPPMEMVDWFNNTPKERIKSISYEMVKQVTQKQK